MPEEQSNTQGVSHDSENIRYARESLIRGEPENKVIADIVHRSFPNDPATGYDYARYILAEARFAREKGHSIHKEQSNMKDTDSRTTKSDQYKRDWAYAIRALEKGDAPEKVITDMATFRKKLPEAQKYAETTVGKAQQYLQVREELSHAAKARTTHAPDYTELDNNFRQTSHLEFARYLYEDGANRQTVTEFLQRERQLEQPEAENIAKEAEIRSFAERDLNYAVRARERGEGDERIIPKIAEYRQEAMENPQDYARAMLETADRVRQLENEHPSSSPAQHQVAAVQQQYRRDLEFAVFRLEHHTLDQVRLEISDRRPEKAYGSPSYRIHRFPDHSYAVAVTEQATRIREVTERGRGLEDTLDVGEREFGRHLQEALNLREAGRTADQITKHIGNGTSPSQYYARAVVNQADTIRENQREMSVRPEMARAAVQQTTPAHGRVTAVER